MTKIMLLVAEDYNQIKPIQSSCFPSPCGSHSVCNNNVGLVSCSCMPHCLGKPPNCRLECSVNSDCPMHLACNNERCLDPCAGSCGISALCSVHNHVPMCTCPQGFTGDPFTSCRPELTCEMTYLRAMDDSLIIFDFFAI